MASTTIKELRPADLNDYEFRILTKKACFNNYTMDSCRLARHTHFTTPREWKPAKEPCAGLGMLDRLPLEMLFMTLSLMPISTIFNLRRTNSYFKRFIEQWEPFRTIINEGANLVHALLTTGAGTLWTTSQVVEVLFTANCEFCGEHGEIVQLLKLKRCCLRCLSRERELFAVSEKYAIETMKLTKQELKTISNLRSIPQSCLWGRRYDHRFWHFDYAAALKILQQKLRPEATEGEAVALLRLPRQVLTSTGVILAEDRRSIQPRPKLSVQARRCQPLLQLPREVVYPIETYSRSQYACSISVPAKKRQTTRLPNGGLQIEITTVPALLCAGCAFYWNYHSPQPWQFHKLYPHRLGQKNSPLLDHLKHCAYARLLWHWLHDPWYQTELHNLINLATGKTFLTRTRQRPGREENSRFEEIEFVMKEYVNGTWMDSTSFVPEYTWPALKSTVNDNSSDSNYAHIEAKRVAAEALLKRVQANEPPRVIQDTYADCLLGQEAISQANWACAHSGNESVYVFGGPLGALMAKRANLERKGWVKQWPPGFNQMYL